MTDYFDRETGEIFEQAIGAGSDAPQFTRLHPDLIQQAFTQLGHAYADLNAAANLMEEMRRPLRARKARGFRKAGMGVAESEVAAEACQEYGDHVAAMVEARRLADRAKVDMEAYRAAWDTARTVAATERTAMRM